MCYRQYNQASGARHLPGELICHFERLCQIMDIAPIILYLMGQPVPGNINGKVLLDIIDNEFRANNPLRYLEPKVDKH